MKLRVAICAAFYCLTGCTTTGLVSADRPAAGDGSQTEGKTVQQMVAAMGGGLIGGTLGSGLDERDRRKALEAEYRALEYTQSGNPVAWKSDSGGRSGTVVPAQPYRVGSQDCRQYQHSVMIDGTSRSARGTACRNADGSWTILT